MKEQNTSETNQESQTSPSDNVPAKNSGKILRSAALVLVGIIFLSGVAYAGWYGYKRFSSPDLKTLVGQNIQELDQMQAARFDYNADITLKEDNKEEESDSGQEALDSMPGNLDLDIGNNFNVEGYYAFDKDDPEDRKGEAETTISGDEFKAGFAIKNNNNYLYLKITALPMFLSMFLDGDKIEDKWVRVDIENGKMVKEKRKELKIDDISEEDREKIKKSLMNNNFLIKNEECRNSEEEIICDFRLDAEALKNVAFYIDSLYKKDLSEDLEDEENWKKSKAILARTDFKAVFDKKSRIIKDFTIDFSDKNNEIADIKAEEVTFTLSLSALNKEVGGIEMPEESADLEKMIKDIMGDLSLSGGDKMIGETDRGGSSAEEDDTRQKIRDSKRVSDIKQIQTDLELFYDQENSYPTVEKKTDLGENGFVCLGDNGFGETDCDEHDSVFMEKIPADPSLGEDYKYICRNGDFYSYAILFSLEEGTDQFGPGDFIATNEEIKPVDIDLTKDSDEDGLFDFEEKHLYGTDPDDPDTDGDGFTDAEEVSGGYDPLGEGEFDSFQSPPKETVTEREEQEEEKTVEKDEQEAKQEEKIEEEGCEYGKETEGGIVAECNDQGEPTLIAMKKDIAEEAKWGCKGEEVGADSESDGEYNTQQIVENCQEEDVAARICAESTEGGYEDWYLPAEDDWFEVGEDTPLHDNLVKNDLGGFSQDSYWSSSENSSNKAKYYEISDMGLVGSDQGKDSAYRVRCVRKP